MWTPCSGIQLQQQEIPIAVHRYAGQGIPLGVNEAVCGSSGQVSVLAELDGSPTTLHEPGSGDLDRETIQHPRNHPLLGVQKGGGKKTLLLVGEMDQISTTAVWPLSGKTIRHHPRVAQFKHSSGFRPDYTDYILMFHANSLFTRW